MAKASKVTVVDAVKTEAPRAQTVNVPVRLDASALTKALQSVAEQTAARVNAGELIKNSAIKIEEIYKRFDALKLLANELNGKPLTAPMPDTIQLEEISFRFRVAKAGNVSETTTATVKTVVCVGDISSLLSSELGSLIVQLEQEAAGVKNIATLTEETSGKARVAWAASNPDRKFTATSAGQSVGADGISLAEQPAAAQKNDTGSI
jgi:hypothetical protein